MREKACLGEGRGPVCQAGLAPQRATPESRGTLTLMILEFRPVYMEAGGLTRLCSYLRGLW